VYSEMESYFWSLSSSVEVVKRVSPVVIPMTDGLSGAESASDLLQSKAEHVRHSYSYGFRVLTWLCGKGDVLCVLQTHPSWV
jgi:hypothetical protein